MISVSIHITNYLRSSIQIIGISKVYIVSTKTSIMFIVLDKLCGYVFKSTFFKFISKQFTNKSLVRFLKREQTCFSLYSNLKMGELTLDCIMKNGKYKILQIIDYDSYNWVS